MSLLSGIRTIRRSPILSRYFFDAQSAQHLSTNIKKIINFKELANAMVKSLNDADLEVHKLLLQNLRLEVTSEETILKQLELEKDKGEINWYNDWLLESLVKKEKKAFPLLVNEASSELKQQLIFEVGGGMHSVKAGETALTKKLMNPQEDNWKKVVLVKEDFTQMIRRDYNLCNQIATTLVERLDHTKLQQLVGYLRSCYNGQMNVFGLVQKTVTLFSLHLDEIEPLLVYFMGIPKMHNIHMLVSARRVRREQLLSDLRYELFHLLRRRDFHLNTPPPAEQDSALNSGNVTVNDASDKKKSKKKSSKTKKDTQAAQVEVQSPIENAKKANSALVSDMKIFTRNRELFYKQRLTFGSLVIFQLKLDCYRRTLQVEPEQKYRIIPLKDTPSRSMKGGREHELRMRIEELERIEKEAYVEDFVEDPPSLASLYHGTSTLTDTDSHDNNSVDSYIDSTGTQAQQQGILEDQFAILKQQLNLSPDRKFLLTNLPVDVTEANIRGMLVNCGKVHSVQIFRHFISDGSSNDDADHDHEQHYEGGYEGGSSDEETLSLSSLPSSSQLHASDAQEVAESLVAFDQEVEELLERRKARRLGHHDKDSAAAGAARAGDIEVSEDVDASEEPLETVIGDHHHDEHHHVDHHHKAEAVTKEDEAAAIKAEQQAAKPPAKTKIMRSASHKLSYKSIARDGRTDTYAMIVMADDRSYDNATQTVIQLFGFNYNGQSCLPVPATQLSHFYVECRYGMRVNDVLYALNIFMEGQFDCYLSRTVSEKLKPVYIKLSFPTHSDAALAFHLLSQNEALVEVSEQSRIVDRTKLWGVTWMRPTRYWDLAKRAKQSMESMDIFTNRMMDQLLEQDIDAAIVAARREIRNYVPKVTRKPGSGNWNKRDRNAGIAAATTAATKGKVAT